MKQKKNSALKNSSDKMIFDDFKDFSPLSETNKKNIESLYSDKGFENCVDLFCGEVNKQIKVASENKSQIIILKNSVENEWGNDDIDFKRLFKKDKKGKWQTEGYIGVVNLKINEKDVTIKISSRFDSETNGNNFLRYVFDKAYNLGDRSEARGRIYNDMSVPSDFGDAMLDELLIRLFFNQMNDAMKKGFYRRYQDFEHNDSKVKGRIDIARHIKENPVSNGRICYSTREYSLDNPINRLIIKAAQCVEKKYRSKYRSILNQYDVCKKGLAILQNELPNSANDSVYRIINNANKKITHSIYRNYESLRQTAIYILRRFGVNSFSDNTRSTGGILIYMPDLWEAFLSNTIMREIANPDKDYAQQSYDGTNKRPDFWFKNKSLIFDAKFKPRWGTAYCKGTWDNETKKDYDQVANYIIDCNCRIGGVVFPIDCKTNNIYDITETPIYKHSDKQFLLIPISIPSEDKYEKFCETMDNTIEQLKKGIENIVNP